MKTTILRAFLITFCMVMVMEGLQAQWGRGRGHSYRSYNRYYSYSRPRVSIGIYSSGYYRYPAIHRDIIILQGIIVRPLDFMAAGFARGSVSM